MTNTEATLRKPDDTEGNALWAEKRARQECDYALLRAGAVQQEDLFLFYREFAQRATIVESDDY